MKKLSFLMFQALFLVFIACNSDDIDDSESTFGVRHDKSLREYEALAVGNNAGLPDFSPTVFFEYTINGKEFVASGVLVSPTWILTAGHNFFDSNDQSSPTPVNDIKVKVGNDPNNPTAILSVSELVFHPTWIASDQDYKDANDICLVKLSSPYNGVTPAKLYSSGNEATGSQIWFSGFGDYAEQPGENESLKTKLHAIANVLDRKVSGLNTSDGTATYSGGLLAIDFDSPEEDVNALGDSVVEEDEGILGDGNSDSKPQIMKVWLFREIVVVHCLLKMELPGK